MTSSREPTPEARALVDRLRAFSLPGGEEAARLVRGVRITERGEIRMAPKAHWIPFTAEDTIDATRSGFRWNAHLRTGALKRMVVTDAYEEGQGRLVVKLGGLVPVLSSRGPEYDKGELQRYLASIVQCPPVLLHHRSLEWTAVGRCTLRVRDLDDSTGATVDLDLGDDGRPLACRADRPRVIGKHTVATPWSGICSEPREWEGLRVPARLEVSWHLPEGLFTYFKAEITSFAVLR